MRHRIVFLEDYDIAVARKLYQGSDVWLNTPRRPMEACGTSGEKAALNGALNCSILDGWWDEMFDGDNGWAIASAEGDRRPRRTRPGRGRQPLRAAGAADRPALLRPQRGPRPPALGARGSRALASLGPQVTATRMVRDYVESMYEPTAERADHLSRHGRAKALATWKARVTPAGRRHGSRWTVDGHTGAVDLGGDRSRVWSPCTSASSSPTTSPSSSSTARSAGTTSCRPPGGHDDADPRR